MRHLISRHLVAQLRAAAAVVAGGGAGADDAHATAHERDAHRAAKVRARDLAERDVVLLVVKK